MRIAGIIKNDIAAAPGVCVTVFVQGCPLHCPGCHNPQTWDFNGGREFTEQEYEEIKRALTANGVHRNLCIMGGEPLAPQNVEGVSKLIQDIRRDLDYKIKIYVWTGYVFEDVCRAKHGLGEHSEALFNLLDNIDCLIDGPFMLEERDITLQMRGSRNQRVIYFRRNA